MVHIVSLSIHYPFTFHHNPSQSPIINHRHSDTFNLHIAPWAASFDNDPWCRFQDELTVTSVPFSTESDARQASWMPLPVSKTRRLLEALWMPSPWRAVCSPCRAVCSPERDRELQVWVARPSEAHQPNADAPTALHSHFPAPSWLAYHLPGLPLHPAVEDLQCPSWYFSVVHTTIFKGCSVYHLDGWTPNIHLADQTKRHLDITGIIPIDIFALGLRSGGLFNEKVPLNHNNKTTSIDCILSSSIYFGATSFADLMSLANSAIWHRLIRWLCI